MDEFDCRVLGFRSIAEGSDPADVGFAAKPGELTLGVVSMPLLSGFHCVGQTRFTSCYSEGLAVAEGVEGFDGAVACEEAAGFFDEARGEHGGTALVEAFVESDAGRIEADAEEAEAGERIVSGFGGEDLREGLARGEADFDRANEFGCVVGVNASGGRRVEAVEEFVKPGWAELFGAATEASAKIFVACGASEEAFGESAEVEACSSRDDGELVAGGYVVEGGAGAA